VQDDDEIDCAVTFHDAEDAVRGFIGAGPMQLAIVHSGERAIDEALRKALALFSEADGRVTLPAWYRVVLTRADTAAP
jgi:hypothetical protein